MRIVSLLLPLGALLACAPATTNEVGPPAARWTASLSPQPEYPAVAASATAVMAGGVTTVQLEVTNAEPGARHPWHVHRGTCEELGGIVGEAGRYPAVEIAAGGRGVATALVEAALEPGAAYAVNVHASPQEMATAVACGELVPADAG